MAEIERLFGLIGYPLSHSFSKKYFSEKFQKENIKHCHYRLFQLESIDQLPNLISAFPNLHGLNVTIPYKQSVIPFLDDIDNEAFAIGAVNVIKIINGKLKGYNSDVYGFELSLKKLLALNEQPDRKIEAIVLGTGGASKAINFVLNKMKIKYITVSRSNKENYLIYEELNADILKKHHLVINCTPLGTYPNIESYPQLPYKSVTKNHFFYDLVYNPTETLFLKKAKAQGASTMNGLPMLHLQAERSWEIWNDVEI